MICQSVFTWLRNHQIRIQSGPTVPRAHRQCRSARCFKPSPALAAGVSVSAVVAGMEQCLIVVLIFISLMTHDVEHLFICLLPLCVCVCVCVFVEVLLRSLVHFSIELFFLLLSIKSSLCILSFTDVFSANISSTL